MTATTWTAADTQQLKHDIQAAILQNRRDHARQDAQYQAMQEHLHSLRIRLGTLEYEGAQLDKCSPLKH